MRSTDEALDALRALPCGRVLLDALAGVPDAVLVGGAVRDLLLGRQPREFDVAVGSEVALERVAGRLGGELRRHERFGTATVRTDGGAYDLVRTRAESYPVAGALPDVRPGTLADDLARRDFTVNAIALDARGTVDAVPDALEDLAAGRLRVLHDGSFVDDPTRLWRLVRYALRLGFGPEPRTDELARAAVAAGALETVSRQRLGNELRLALGEPAPAQVLHAAQQLGLVGGLTFDPAVLGALDALRPPEADPGLTLLGATLPDGGWAGDWSFTSAEQHVLARCAELAPLPADGTLAPSDVARMLRGEPVEAIVVAGAKGDPRTALRWLGDWRHVALEITGDDLLAAGMSAGPQMGRRLAAVLDSKLDGDVRGGRDAELRAALDLR